MLFSEFMHIQEALKIVKRLKDKLQDSPDAYKYLEIGKIDGYVIKKSKHSLDDRGEVRRDKGVPESYIIDKIKEAYPQIKSNKDTVLVFTHDGKYNMLILHKDTKFKQLVIKTEILQNRNKNTYKFKSSDESILIEKMFNNEDLDYISIREK